MRIRYLTRARKALRKMPHDEAVKVRERIAALAADPHAPGLAVRALKGRRGYRLRVGRWRVIYEWDDDTLAILAISPRRQAYR